MFAAEIDSKKLCSLADYFPFLLDQSEPFLQDSSFSPFRMATAFSSLFPIWKGSLYSVEPAEGSVPSVV